MRLIVILFCLSACVQAPRLPQDGIARSETAAYPALVPLGPILAQAAIPTEPDPTMALDDRASALDTRANALRGQVIDTDTLGRLTGGVDSAALQ